MLNKQKILVFLNMSWQSCKKALRWVDMHLFMSRIKWQSFSLFGCFRFETFPLPNNKFSKSEHIRICRGKQTIQKTTRKCQAMRVYQIFRIPQLCGRIIALCPQTTRDEKDTAMREQHCRITLFWKWHDKVKSLVGFHSWFDYAETVPRLCITPFLTVEVVRFINVNC